MRSYHGASTTTRDTGFHIPALPSDVNDLDEDGKVCESLPVDFEGNPRFADDPGTVDTGCGLPVVVDMGVYEFAGEALEVVYADANADGVVDVLDLLALFPDWGPHDGCSLSDLDVNGVVDVLDMLKVLEAWGSCE